MDNLIQFNWAGVASVFTPILENFLECRTLAATAIIPVGELTVNSLALEMDIEIVAHHLCKT